MNRNIPHQYWYVDSHLLQGYTLENLAMVAGHPIPVIVHAVQSRPGKCLMFHVLTDFGANYSGVPIHALSIEIPDAMLALSTAPLPPSELQAWSCFDDQPEVIAYEYLSGRRGSIRFTDRTMAGTYVLTVYWPKSAYTAQSTQYKEAHVMVMDNGQIAAMPNNRILWSDASFVTKPMPDYKLRVIHPSQWIDPEIKTKPHEDGFIQSPSPGPQTSQAESGRTTPAVSTCGAREHWILSALREQGTRRDAHIQSRPGKTGDQSQGRFPRVAQPSDSQPDHGQVQDTQDQAQVPSGNAQAKAQARQQADSAQAFGPKPRLARPQTKPAKKSTLRKSGRT